ncbi:MAG TPA: transaldolase family protein [Stellaceae bacterium]|nr:transaldolase family protein [Stellaceae bacterium]
MTLPAPLSPSRLRLFLDTAKQAEWDEWLGTGLFYGVTSNPTLLKAADIPCRLPEIGALVSRAVAAGMREVHAQTWGVTAERLVAHGKELAALDPRIVVKVPITRNGIIAVRELRAAGIPTTLTALYAPHQAVTAAAAGVDYAAPYLGRIDDSGRDGHAEVAMMQAILTGLGSPTRLLVASIRGAGDLARLAAAGLDTFTFSAKIAAELFADPRTRDAAAAFEDAVAGV